MSSSDAVVVATSSSSDVDGRICALVAKIHAKVPADKKLTAGVVVQLLGSKFQAQFPDVVFADKVAVIEAEIKRLQTPPPTAAPAAPAAASTTAPAAEGDDDSDDDDDDSDASEELEEDEESDEELSSSGSDDDDEESSEEAEGGVEGGEPAAKKARLEENAGRVGEDVEESAVAGMEPAVRVPLMLAFTSKLGYRPRKQTEGESIDEYLTSYLIPFFTSKQLNPNEFGRTAVKKYKLRKELHDLQADGGSLALDRTQRRGRGVIVVPPPQSDNAAPKPVFMDEEEE